MNRSRRIAVGGIAIAAIVVAGIAVGPRLIGPPEHHADGEGPLASLNRSGTHVGMTVDRTASSVWTFGYELCLAQGDQPAIIDSVGPTQTIGAGFKYLGSLIRTFDVQPGVDSSHEPIGSVDGFLPPTRYASDYLRDAIGYPVSVLCATGPPVTYTELLVGFAATGPDGGGWRGIDIGYSVGGRHHIVSLGYDQLICGTSTEYPCAAPTSSPSPPSPGPS